MRLQLPCRRLLGICAVIASFSTAMAGNWTEEVDALYAEWDSAESPGVMLAIVQDGEMVHARAFGMANIERGRAIEADSLFNVASISKQFTAAAAAMLALEGKLDLDRDIREVLPYLPHYEPTITVRHLVHHTSGIPDVFAEMQKRKIQFEYPYGNEDMLPVIATIDENDFEAGAKYAYSNSNYILLAEIVQKISGQSLREFTRERIFEPLGMAATHVGDRLDELDRPLIVESYQKRKKQYVHIPRNDYVVGDGNVLTSVVEMARWGENFRTKVVGGEAFVEMMLTRGQLNSGETIDYAMGISVSEVEGRRRYSHGGSWLGYKGHWAYFPDEGTAIMVFANHGQYVLHQDEVAKIYFAAREKAGAQEVTAGGAR